MAIYHFHFSSISRQKGHSAIQKSAYISTQKRELDLDYNAKLEYDYTKKSNATHTEIILPENENNPKITPNRIWNMAEKSEKRKDACVAYEIEISLENSLSDKKNIYIAKKFIEKNITKRGLACEIGYHTENNQNKHMHILISTRKFENGEFSQKKDREFGRKELLGELRTEWANTFNRYLEMENKPKISEKTLSAQGIERPPQIHLGKRLNAMSKKRNYDEKPTSTKMKEYNEHLRGLELQKSAINEHKIEKPIISREKPKKALKPVIINSEIAELEAVLGVYSSELQELYQTKEKWEKTREIKDWGNQAVIKNAKEHFDRCRWAEERLEKDFETKNANKPFFGRPKWENELKSIEKELEKSKKEKEKAGKEYKNAVTKAEENELISQNQNIEKCLQKINEIEEKLEIERDVSQEELYERKETLEKQQKTFENTQTKEKKRDRGMVM